MKKLTLKYYFHIHHEILAEPLTEPLKNRIKYIKEDKPKDEIELRLKLIKPVKGKLPSEFIEASQAWAKADQARGKAYLARGKARQAWAKALEDNTPAIEKLHKKECGCGWNGKTIFTKENGLEK